MIDTEADDDTVFGYHDVLADSNLEDDSYTDSDSTLVTGGVGDDPVSDRTNWSTSSIELEDSDARSGVTSDLEDSDTDDIFSDWSSDVESDAGSDLGMESDASSVTDDGYLAGNEETQPIL